MSSVRAFLAIPLDKDLKQQIANCQTNLKNTIHDVRWSNLQNLHLTLHFFGDTSQENLEKIKASMLSVKRCQRPFEVEVKGLGGFPRRRRSRVIWLGLDPEEPLRHLHRDIVQSARDVGIPIIKGNYAPHLTIGRVRGKAVDITEYCVTLTDTAIGHLAINKMTLFESRLNANGAEHIPLFTVNFDEKTDTLS